MRFQRFVAADMREAIARIKAELGPEALVVSSRSVRRGLLRGGVEVTAAIEDPEPVLPPSVVAPPALPPDGDRMARLERANEALRLELSSIRAMMRRTSEASPDDAALVAEVRALREAVRKLSGTDGRRRASARAPEEGPPNVTVTVPTRPITMLVGPTGAGKSTTVAKLAARAALVEGRPTRVVTLDAHRPGAVAQMKTITDAIGVELTVVDDVRQLADRIGKPSSDARVFVDTPGCGSSDGDWVAALAASLAEKKRVGRNVDVQLVIPVSMQAGTIDAYAERFEALGIVALILTKIDEAEALHELSATPSRLGLPASYLTTGPRIPEDIEPATVERIVALASRTASLSELVA